MYLDSPLPKEGPGLRSNLDSESCSLSSCPSEFAGELPPGWRCRQSRKWGRPFYYHSASGRSQWHPPTPDTEHQSTTMCWLGNAEILILPWSSGWLESKGLDHFFIQTERKLMNYVPCNTHTVLCWMHVHIVCTVVPPCWLKCHFPTSNDATRKRLHWRDQEPWASTCLGI